MANHLYTDTELEAMRQKLLEIQRDKKLFVTVREAAAAIGKSDSTGAAVYKLEALIDAGMVDKVRNHYHVKEHLQEPENKA